MVGTIIHEPIIKTNGGVVNQLLLINKRIFADIVDRKPDAILVSQAISNDYDFKPVQDAILRLKAYSPNVSILGETPVFPDSSRFMKSMPIIVSPYIPPKVFKRNLMNTGPFEVSEKMELWSKKNGVNFISAIPIFCDDAFCKRWNSQGWLYRDSDHLSVLGAQLTVPILSNWISSLD